MPWITFPYPHDISAVLASDLPDAIVGGALDRDSEAGAYITGTVVPALLAQAERHGVVPAICHDLDVHRALWECDYGRAPFSAMIDPALQPDHTPTDTAIMVLLRDDRPIGTYTARWRWVDGTLADAIDSGRLIYGDPARAPKGDVWRCTAPGARDIRDCGVAVGGGIWTDQAAGAMDRRLLPLLSRMMITWLVAEWRWTWFVGFSLPRPAAVHAFPTYAATRVEHGLIVRQGAQVAETRVVYAPRSHYLELIGKPEFLDLTRPLDGFGDALDRVVAS